MFPRPGAIEVRALSKDPTREVVRGSYQGRDESVPNWDPLPSPPNEPGAGFERTPGFGASGRQVASTHWNGGLRLSFTPNENHDILLDFDIARQKYDNSEGRTGTLDRINSLWRSASATIRNANYTSSAATSAAIVIREPS